VTTVPSEVRLSGPGQLTGAPVRTGALRRGRRIRLNGGFAAMSLVTIVVAFLVLFPLAMLVFGSFWTARPGFPGTLTLDNYIKAYTDPDTYRILLTTVLLVGAKTVLAVSFASALAWIVTRTDTPFRGTLEVLLTVPFFIPGLLEAIGWIMLLSPNTGTINVWLKALLGLSDAPLNIYSLGGMIWVMSLGSTSFIFLLLVNALRNMDASLEESARASGAGPVRTALTVTLPLVAPVILGAGMLSFIRAMDSFEVPVLLGMPAKVFVFSNRIYAAIQYDYPVNYGLATALGVSFFALIGLLIFVQSRILHGKQFFVVTGKGYQPRIVRLGLVVGQTGLAKHVQVGLAVQMRGQITIHPRVVLVVGHLYRAPGRCGHPAHQFGLHVTRDLLVVGLHPGEPAVVFLQPEQRPGVVEQHRAQRRHEIASLALTALSCSTVRSKSF